MNRGPSVMPTAREPELPSPLWGLVLLALPLAIVVGLFYGTVWLWDMSAPKEVMVPQVKGVSLQAAEKALEMKGLQPRTVAWRVSETVPEGRVIEEFPPAGRVVKQGRPVSLSVSKGSAWTTVPDVTEMPAERAREILLEENLVLAKEYQTYHPTAPEGSVIKQSLKPGTRIKKGSELEALVSKGPKPPPAPPEDRLPEFNHKMAEVEVPVPQGEGLHEVRVVVQDDNGRRTAYREFHKPGELVTVPVEGDGQVKVQVFVDGDKVEERTL